MVQTWWSKNFIEITFIEIIAKIMTCSIRLLATWFRNYCLIYSKEYFSNIKGVISKEVILKFRQYFFRCHGGNDLLNFTALSPEQPVQNIHEDEDQLYMKHRVPSHSISPLLKISHFFYKKKISHFLHTIWKKGLREIVESN